MAQQAMTSGAGRVWIQPQGIDTPLLYAGCYGMGDVAIPEGDITRLYCPSRLNANEWDVTGTLRGAPGNPTTNLEAPIDLVNYLLTVKCPLNVQYRMGLCGRPDDPAGWDTMLAFVNAEITSRGVTGLNGRSPDTNSEVLVTADLTFDEMYFVRTLTFAGTQVTATVGATMVDIAFCDTIVCAGPCGIGSPGCQVGYTITTGITGGGGEEIWKTVDGGDNWVLITSPFTEVYDDFVAIACKEDVVILVNGTTASTIARSIDGGATWTVIDVGGAQVVADVFMLNSAEVWLVGAGGYIWYSDDGGVTWVIQDAGIATNDALAEVHFADEDYGIAVGANGAIVRTINGGTDWEAATSGTAEHLTCCFCVTDIIYFVGGANAALLDTRDRGVTWNARTWPGAATDTIEAIVFCGLMFGFFGGTTTDPLAVMYRTLDGGYTFVAQVLPTNLGINALWCCDPNTVFIATDTAGTVLQSA